MKTVMIAIALAGTLSTASVFAQSAPSATQVASTATRIASNGTSAILPGGQWVPPYGQPVVEKTRKEVYRELMHAEKDGQLAYLDSTLYAH
jgi:hypothetical protein